MAPCQGAEVGHDKSSARAGEVPLLHLWSASSRLERDEAITAPEAEAEKVCVAFVFRLRMIGKGIKSRCLIYKL